MRDHKQSTALLVLEGGKVVLTLGPVEKPFPCHSVRKSFISALFGTLQVGGRLALDKTVLELGADDEPPLSAVENKATLRDLLSARSGIYRPASYETAKMKQNRPEMGSHAPGTFYYYNNWDFNALGTIFTKLSSLQIGEAFRTRLAVPLGMEDFDVTRDFKLLRDRDPDVSIHPAYPFLLSTRDRARFGLLYLARGSWKGTRIVPEDWVKESTRAHSSHSAGDPMLSAGQGYGYLWWCADGGRHFGYKFPDNTSYSARGVGGQYIAVIPTRSLVIAHSNDTNVAGYLEPGEEFNKLFGLIMSAQKL